MSAILYLALLWGNPGCSSEIVALKSDDFYRREKASKRLEMMGWRAIPQLCIATNFRDPEQRRRAERLIDDYFFVNPEHESQAFPSVYCFAGPKSSCLFTPYPHEVPTDRREEEPTELNTNPPSPDLLEPAWATALLAHLYYGRVLLNEGKKSWHYYPEQEVLAMELLIHDCRLVGIPKKWIQSMVAFARTRSNPEPPGMPKPPSLLRYVVTGSFKETQQ